MKKLLILLVFACFVIGGSACYFGKQLFYAPLSTDQTILLDLPHGSNVRTLATKLHDLALVPHPILVRLAARLSGYDKQLKAGEYQIDPEMSLADVFERIASGKVVFHHLTLPEGLTTAQMLDLIEKNEFLNGPLPSRVREGDLLPETYTFHKGMTRRKFVRLAQEAMRAKLDEIWQNRDPDLPLRTPQELVILASIVEKETALNDERTRVASVFINRLEQGMLLQTDPTVIYALTQGKTELGRPLTRQDLKTDSPYNTYKYVGLPPSPIANPGEQSLLAAAHPAKTPYLYFVADGQGGHNFAKTLDEHNQNVRHWKQIHM